MRASSDWEGEVLEGKEVREIVRFRFNETLVLALAKAESVAVRFAGESFPIEGESLRRLRLFADTVKRRADAPAEPT